MQTKVQFSAKRFLLTLLLCACSVILLQSFDLAQESSFTFQLLCVGAGLLISFLFFIPSLIIKKKTDLDFLTLAHLSRPKLSPFLAVFYALYFVYTAAFFLLPYTDMFCKKYFPETSPCFVALLLLTACVYAAFKGVNVITRFGIFLFVFALLANLLMMGGSVGSLDFDSYSFALRGSARDFLQNTVYFVTPSFIAVVFGSLSGFTKNFRVRQTVLTLLFTGVKYAAILFFIWFALGDYGRQQEYQTFLLSRVAHFSTYSGVESVYLALATMSVFMILSLFLCCIGKSVGESGVMRNIVLFSLIIFILHTCAVYLNSVKELLTNTAVMVGFTFIAAVIIPTVVWRGSRRRCRRQFAGRVRAIGNGVPSRIRCWLP